VAVCYKKDSRALFNIKNFTQTISCFPEQLLWQPDHDIAKNKWKCRRTWGH